MDRDELIRSTAKLSNALMQTNRRIKKAKQMVEELINDLNDGTVMLEDLDEVVVSEILILINKKFQN